MKRLYVLLLLILPMGGASGAEIVSWIGTRDRVIDGRPIDIPLDLATPVDAKAPSVIQVTTSGREVNATTVKATLSKVNSQTYLHLVPDAAPLARTGTYLVKIRIPAAGNFSASIIELILTRPSGELSLAVPMRTERILYAPGFDRWFPKRWPLAALGESVTPVARERVIAFTGPDQKPTGAKLKLALPESVVAGKQNDITLASAAPFPIGTSTGKLMIDAPQLTKPFETSIEVVARVSRGWLLITIALSIVIGHFVRNTLEQRRLRALALASVGEQLEELAQLAKTTTDDAFKAEFESAATALENAARNEDANLEDAMKTAKAAIEDIRKRMTEAQTQIEARLKALQSSIREPAVQIGPVRQIVEDLAQEVADAQKNLVAGQLGRAKEDADRLTKTLPARLEEARGPWTTLVQKVVTKAGMWPESPANEQLRQALDAAQKIPQVQSPEEAATFIGTAATVTGDLRNALYRIVSGMRELAGRVVKELDPFRQEVASQLDTLTTLHAQAVAAEIEPLADQAAAFRSVMTAALSGIVPKAQPVPSAVDEGRFAQGLADVLALRAGKALGDAAPFLVSARGAETKAVPPARTIGPIPVTLIQEEEAVAGRTVRVRVQVEDSSIPASAIVVTWYRGDERLHTGPAGDLVLRYRPADGEPVMIRADAIAGERTGTGSLRVVARLPVLIDPENLRKLSRWDGLKQTVVAGAFILAIGYLIFAESFLGQPMQFLTAALWGFTVDVTLPKLMTYAAPVAAKTLVFP